MKNGNLTDREPAFGGWSAKRQPQIFEDEIREELEAEDASTGGAVFNMFAAEMCEANDR